MVKHLDRRLVLQQGMEVPTGELIHPHAGRHRQQEWEPVAQHRAAAGRFARPRGRAAARRPGGGGSHPYGMAIDNAPVERKSKRASSARAAATSGRTSPIPATSGSRRSTQPRSAGWSTAACSSARLRRRRAGQMKVGVPHHARAVAVDASTRASRVLVPAARVSEFTCALRIEGADLGSTSSAELPVAWSRRTTRARSPCVPTTPTPRRASHDQMKAYAEHRVPGPAERVGLVAAMVTQPAPTRSAASLRRSTTGPDASWSSPGRR